MHRLVATIYWLSLLTWLAALVAGGVTAMSAFSSLPALGVVVPEAALLFPGAGTESGRYAAGFVAQPAFAFAERVGLVSMPILAAALLVQARVFRWPARSWANRLRVGAIVVGIALMSMHLLVLAPRMTDSLDAYRRAVRDGNAPAAEIDKAAFDADHVKSDFLFRTTLYLLVAAAALSAWTMTPARPPVGRGRGDVQSPRVWVG